MVDLVLGSDGAERVEALRTWLAEQPFEWGPALATRAAFRTIPWLFCNPASTWLNNFSVHIFHALFIAWSTSSSPIKGHKHAADLSTNLLYPAAMHHASEAYYASGMRQIDQAIIARTKIDKVDHSIRALVAFDNLIRAKINVVSIPEGFFWESLQEDIDVLSKSSTNKITKSLLGKSFVPDKYFGSWINYLNEGLSTAVQLDGSFSVWKVWVEDIVRFRRRNFFERDKSLDASVKDRQVASSIIHRIDTEFWSRPVSKVNADIENWVATQSVGLSSEIVGVGNVPAQNSNVISFTTDHTGKIELSDIRHLDVPSEDEDSLDRYEECLTNAKQIYVRCRGSNSAGRLVGLLEKYLLAAGDKIADLRPSLFVQRGERLRQEIAAYMSHDNMLAPLADDILLDLKAWEASHNMLVGLDAALLARDTALLGPGDRIANVAPTEIKDVLLDADRSGLLAENVIEVVVEATILAPEIPDPLNRRTIWSFETGRNLVIEAFNIALRNPTKATVGGIVAVAAVGSLGPAGTILSLAATAVPAGKFLLRHRAWIEGKLGDSPTWRALFSYLAESLANDIPIPDNDTDPSVGPKNR